MAFSFNFGASLNLNLANNGNANVIPGLPGVSVASPGPQVNQNFSIQNFIQNLSAHNETARTNKFDVVIVPPATIASYAGLSPATIAKGLNLQCEVSQLPGRDIQMTEYITHAFIRRTPHVNQYGQASFTFICTGDFWEKIFFDAWIDYMIPAQTGLVNYPLDPNNNRNYETDILVNQYDSTGTNIYQASLIDATPIGYSTLNQAWDQESIHKLNVTFQFRKWVTAAMTFNQSTTFSAGNPQPLPTQISTNPAAPSPIPETLSEWFDNGSGIPTI